MNPNRRAEFFDRIADKWDGWENIPVLNVRFAERFIKMNIQPNEVILDVGCGTGNLTKALLLVLNDEGSRVVAIDISSAMLSLAKRKIQDQRVVWLHADAASIPKEDQSVDRIICYSVWPHLDQVESTVQEFKRLLRPHGFLHIWHLSGRESINKIHQDADETIKHDLLHPAEETALLLKQFGFQVQTALDEDQEYLVTAQKA